MLGLGEEWDEIVETLKNLHDQTQCDLLTVGQYLSPTKNHLPIEKYYTPEEFKEVGRIATQMGFPHVASGPFVRSSYFAERLFQGLASPPPLAKPDGAFPSRSPGSLS